jgi:hypothetical protein
MPKKTNKIDLPDSIIPIECADKEGWSESWSSGRNWLNFPHPTRGVFCGLPSSGKSTYIKNIIIRTIPHYEEIIVSGFDNDNSKEWDDKLKVTFISGIPDPKSFNRDKKRLLIIEDLDTSNLKPVDKSNLNRLFGYTSSHCNLSIFLTCQNPFDVKPPIRRMANLFVLFKSHDMNSLITLSSRTGIKSKHMVVIMSQLLTNPHDSLTIDLQQNSPAIYRINGYQKITLKELDEMVKEAGI